MNSNQIVLATYASKSKQSEITTRLRYGDLEICLKDGSYYFISRGGARISNIREIKFNTSIIRGITDDITTIPIEDQKHFALSAFPKVLTLGKYKLTEEFIKGILDDINNSTRES